MDRDLIRVREEIRKADEALVRQLVALPCDSQWETFAEARPECGARIELGLKVAESKFRLNPERFRALAAAGDVHGLEKAITDARTEEAVLARAGQNAAACGCGQALIDRIVDLYRNRIIPETRRIQVRRLLELAR